MNPDIKLKATQRWVERFVVGKRLCPFAAAQLQHNRLAYVLSEAATAEALLEDLGVELQRLLADDSITTTLLVHPYVLNDFSAYNQFLDAVDALLEMLNLEGVYQVASFHPDYQFAEAGREDPENYTNRSPYPMLHLLPEAMVSDALLTTPVSASEITSRNIALLQKTGSSLLAEQWRACFKDG